MKRLAAAPEPSTMPPTGKDDRAMEPEASDRDLDCARRVLAIEAEAIHALERRLGRPFLDVIDALAACPGKVVLSGTGKSGDIARKIAGTLASTGTPAVFLDPVEAMHGGLGIIAPGDEAVTISNSGESSEGINFLFAAKRLGVRVITLTGDLESTMAANSDLVLDTSVAREACPLGLAPTASTTATLALGDAIAAVLMTRKGFKEDGYARLHPGGTLGRRLKQKVADVMRTGEQIPAVPIDAPLTEAVRAMTDVGNHGFTLVLAEDGALAGIITDGDVRRQVLRAADLVDPQGIPCRRVMTPRPRTIEPDAPLSDALQRMEVKGITSLVIVDTNSRPIGVVTLHDVLGRGKVLLMTNEETVPRSD
jgi:arabinose-5-phosphate isomerase